MWIAQTVWLQHKIAQAKDNPLKGVKGTTSPNQPWQPPTPGQVAQSFNPFDPNKFKAVGQGIGAATNWVTSQTQPITNRFANVNMNPGWQPPTQEQVEAMMGGKVSEADRARITEALTKTPEEEARTLNDYIWQMGTWGAGDLAIPITAGVKALGGAKAVGKGILASEAGKVGKGVEGASEATGVAGGIGKSAPTEELVGKMFRIKPPPKVSFVPGQQVGETLKPSELRSMVDETAQSLVSELKAPKKPITPITTSPERTIADKSASWFNRTFRTERILEKLDNYNPNGNFQKVFYAPFNNARNQELKQVVTDIEGFRAGIKSRNINLSEMMGKPQVIEGVVDSTGKPIMLTGQQKIGVHLLSQNEDALRHLYTGNGFTPKQVSQITVSLTPDEKYVADYLLNFFNSEGRFGGLAQVVHKVTGKVLPKVANYFPIRILRGVPENVFSVEKQIAQSQAGQFAKNYAVSYINKWFTRARVPKANQAINVNAIDTWFEATQDVAHYQNFASVVQDADRLLLNPVLRTRLMQEGGDVYGILRKWVMQVADSDSLLPKTALDRSMRTLRVNAATAALGFNITTGLKQFVSFFTGMSELGEKATMQGLFTYLRHPNESIEMARKYSPQLYNRLRGLGGFEREVAEAEWMKGVPKKIMGKLSPREVFMGFSHKMDEMAVGSMYRGGIDDFLAKHPDATMQEASNYAEKAIRETQAWFDVKDLPEFYRSGEMGRAITMFTNELNNQWNYFAHEVIGSTRAGQQSKAQSVRKIIEGFVIPATLIGMISRSRPAQNAQEYSKDMAMQALSYIPIWGSWLSAGFQGFRGGGIVTTEPMERAGQIPYYAAKGQPGKVAQSAGEFAGYMLGLPVNQLERTGKGIYDLAQQNTNDWLRLIWSEYTRATAGQTPTKRTGTSTTPKAPTKRKKPTRRS
jgi:hypothetical protein